MEQAVQQLIEKSNGKEHFAQQMQDFLILFNRFVNEKDQSQIDWEKIRTPSEEDVKPYDSLADDTSDEAIQSLLSKLIVIKLNGGLGTTMGCTGPKSVIQVREEDTFLDLTIKQIQFLNSKYNVDVPLVLMNSFNTSEDSKKIITAPKYANVKVRIECFEQNQFPRIIKESLLPLPSDIPSDSNKEAWYPPGHGDFYSSFFQSPLYNQFKQEGKEYIFLSNIDNLGATVDLRVLKYLTENQVDFCMEVTKKTMADVKGGTLINYDGKAVKLLELAQVPKHHVKDFESIEKFKIFNTNNLWIRLPSIETQLEELKRKVEIINNEKEVDGVKIIQLETAAGAAIQVFNKSLGIEVPRSRFLPVKKCSDLMLVQSNLYNLSEGYCLEKSSTEEAPIINLDDSYYKKVGDYLSNFSNGVPDIKELTELDVRGHVVFGKNVVLKGKVTLIAKSKSIIADNTVLENTTLQLEPVSKINSNNNQ
ncbi:UDP-glucose pyrophosphorylase 2-like protein [Naegleria gruberi]|uniref:UTP--glucose-1-phosphate uridylyltransferase n=1 Tax=Naegleria gruberi TaxID=5762 RepID=D2VSC7_NAEGR|nr:UDP-glucose pyrophosphorylase 2-like protein [Naegleria gruberi]EFC40399.1 UDP-glucose pyrophosphorylase 2-like protein [Naegleria gruberi]|eukprot:XP_002673143.1 UDP-glucose pyrophosphorylase 2-like protein [Naegleria gruberi strain NEG-M]